VSPLVLIATLALGIIGGTDSTAATDDAAVCILADTLPVCSGVLVGVRTVLTAGHCVNPLGAQVSYAIGIGPDCGHPRVRIAIAQMQAHPQYTAMGQPFDLGLAQLSADAPASVTPFEVATLSVDPSVVGQLIRHVGYGTNLEFPMSGWGTRRTVSHAVLRLDADFLWSGDATHNTCTGDSGGPVLVADQVIAVVSDGPDCHSPSADQRLDRGSTWLQATRASWEPKPTPAPKTGCASAPTSLAFALSLLLLRRHSRMK
jgi:secreted trypsin-like serine protease